MTLTCISQSAENIDMFVATYSISLTIKTLPSLSPYKTVRRTLIGSSYKKLMTYDISYDV